MDFFLAQERARKASRRLVCWFSLCVIGVIATLYALAVLVKPHFGRRPYVVDTGWWDPQLLAIIAPTIGGIIVLGSLFKLMQLSAGGAVVARDLGGRPVDPSTKDPQERRLLNVVEEMAIASGLPAPEIWILDEEEGINAFAAGTDASNAVIGVTRGCLERFNRSELQGVIAHEFSHILNGDMKLNMRLIGWIFGLVMIAMLGRMLLELLRYTRGSRDSKGGGGIMLAIVGAGLALWLVGSVGSFFARLLQAGVSRQREYLADASAVQFTRNPDGLADALRKVGGSSLRGKIHSSKAQEARHMFFASSDMLKLGFATHPPLPDRIKAIMPSWDGSLLASSGGRQLAGETSPPPVPSRLAPATAAFALNTLGDSGRMDPQVGVAIRRQLEDGHVVFLSTLDAKALLYGLLLAQDPAEHEQSLALVSSRSGPEMAEQAEVWNQALAGKSAAEKLALVDLSLPWLRRMNRAEGAEFIEVTRDLIAADGHVNLFEFMLQKVIARHVGVGLGLRPVAKIRHQSLDGLRHETAVLLGAFAAISGDEESLANAAAEYSEHTGRELERLPSDACGLDAVAMALDQFEASTPMVKVRILRLCGLVATHDGVLEDGEVELLRAAAEAIGAPIPPLARAAAV